METYWRGSKKRSLRTRSVETRDAVKLATQPDSSSTRTLAISTLGDKIGRPTARTSRTGELAKVSTMSRSWIIRSSTTSTSSARGVKTESRCASKNMGRRSCGCTASTAGLKRSKCPGCRMHPPICAMRIRSSASASVAASGFSTSKSRPASSRAEATA